MRGLYEVGFWYPYNIISCSSCFKRSLNATIRLQELRVHMEFNIRNDHAVQSSVRTRLREYVASGMVLVHSQRLVRKCKAQLSHCNCLLQPLILAGRSNERPILAAVNRQTRYLTYKIIILHKAETQRTIPADLLC